MINNDQNLVILAAGHHEYDSVKYLTTQLNLDTSIFERILCNFNCSLTNTHVIVPSIKSQLKLDGSKVNTIVNERHDETLSTGSFLKLLDVLENDTFVTYVDVIAKEPIDHLFNDTEADILVGVVNLENKFFPKQILPSETIVSHQGNVTSLGQRVHPQENLSISKFCGVVFFKKKAIDLIKSFPTDIQVSIENTQITHLIEMCRASGCLVQTLDLDPFMLELNDKRDLARFILGTKADTLSNLQNIVSKSKILPQVVVIADDWLSNKQKQIDNIRAKFEDNTLIVRSSSSAEDGFEHSNAGGFESVLDVSDNQQLTEAIDKVIASYGPAFSGQQILIQPMLKNVSLSGVIFTRTLENRAPWSVINFAVGNDTSAVTAGSDAHTQTFYISKYCSDENILKNLHPAIPQLVAVIDELKEILLFDELDVEFAVDDFDNVYVLQVRPLANFSKYDSHTDLLVSDFINKNVDKWKSANSILDRRLTNVEPVFGVMPDWNPVEILGRFPGNLSISLYEELITNETWALQRKQFGYQDVRGFRLLSYFSGLPHVDVRLSLLSFIPSEFGEEICNILLKFYTSKLKNHPELHDKVEFRVLPTCGSVAFDTWRRELRLNTSLSTQAIDQYEEALQKISRNCVADIDKHYRRLDAFTGGLDYYHESSDDLNSYDKILYLVQICKRYGTLPFAHLARSAFVAMTWLKDGVDAGLISRTAMEEFLGSINTVSSTYTKDLAKLRKGALSLPEFLDIYGHLRPGTYDISSATYKESSSVYIQNLVSSLEKNSFEPEEEIKLDNWAVEKVKLFEALDFIEQPHVKIESFMRASIEGRELSKFIFTKALSEILDIIKNEFQHIENSVAVLEHLSLSEILEILQQNDHKNEECIRLLKEKSQWNSAQKSIARYMAHPDLITDVSQFYAFEVTKNTPNYVTNDNVTSEVISLSDANVIEDYKVLDNKIVLIESADPGFDWIFGAKISGLITMYGGANSHMAIRAAEYKLPAAIGVGKEMYNQIASAQLITLKCDDRRIDIVK